MFQKTLLISAMALMFGSSVSVARPARKGLVLPAAVQEQAQPTQTTDAMRESYATVETESQVKDSITLAREFVQSAVDHQQLSDGMGWNEAQKTYVAVSTAYLPMDGLSSADFARLRAMKFTEAVMEAKADTIRFIRTDLSVENLVRNPDTGLGTQYDQQNRQVRLEIEAARKELQQFLLEVDQAEANAVGGIDLAELGVESVAASFEKVVGNIDLDKLSAKQEQRLAKLKEKVAQAQAHLLDLQAQLEKLRGQLQQENVSQVEMIAAMPLLGAMTIGSFDSVIDGQYQVSVVVSWSAAQERFVRSVLNGEPMTLKPGKMSLNQYIKSLDLTSAIGGRKFLDNEGRVHIIGIGAWPVVGKGSAGMRSAEGFAGAQATSMIGLSLRGDVAAREMAASKAQELRSADGGTETQVKENFVKQLTENLKNMQLQGVSTRVRKQVKDPFTGQKMFVIVKSMSVNDSLAARKVETKNYEQAILQENTNQQSKGYKDGMENELHKAEQSKKFYNEGVQAGRKSVRAVETPAVVAPKTSRMPKAKTSAPKQERTLRGRDVADQSRRSSGTSTDSFAF